jgi:penicillin-insensitive murein endopeptidase
MMTPVDVIAGLWLAAWPAWGGIATPVWPYAPVNDPPPVVTPSHESPASLLDLSDDELLKRVEADPASLGSLSIGTPGSAILMNAVALPDGGRWAIARGAVPWGTSETIASIETAVNTVSDVFPGTPPLVIGDISDVDGGRLKRHASHQGGRDVDFGFYYNGGPGTWFVPGTSANLDLPRNWALVRALLVRTDVEMILLDTRIQILLYRYALSVSEDQDWLDRVFQFSRGSSRAIICYAPRHRDHYHVRFYSPVAQELGRRAHPFLVQTKVMAPPVFTVRHVVRSGQTLGHLATRYGTTVSAIKQANGLATTQLRAGRAYRIPVRAAAPPTTPIVVPLRMLPPSTPEILASVAWPTQQSLYSARLPLLTEPPGLLDFVSRRF